MADRYVSPHPRPPAHEAELLGILMEECLEINLAAESIIMAMGIPSSDPLHVTLSSLGREIGDLLQVAFLLGLPAPIADVPETVLVNTGEMNTRAFRSMIRLIRDLLSKVNQAGIRASKANRFGFAETQPGQPHDNHARLRHALDAVWVVLGDLMRGEIIAGTDVLAGFKNKEAQLNRFRQCFQLGDGQPSRNCKSYLNTDSE